MTIVLPVKKWQRQGLWSWTRMSSSAPTNLFRSGFENIKTFGRDNTLENKENELRQKILRIIPRSKMFKIMMPLKGNTTQSLCVFLKSLDLMPVSREEQ